MNSLSLSVIICTHNPRGDYFGRVLASLRAQTLPQTEWELLLVDNASSEPLSRNWDLSWHPRARHICETDLGLTPARLRGIREAAAEVLVFVDDDNVMAPDYLEQALALSQSHPWVGAFGACLKGEFERPLEPWMKPMLPFLAIHDITAEEWAFGPGTDTERCCPCGAGMVIRKSVAVRYAEVCARDPLRRGLDRRGASLVSSGDMDMALCAGLLGMAIGRFPQLQVLHLIAARRLEREYLLKLAEGTVYSYTIIQYLWRAGHIPALPGRYYPPPPPTLEQRVARMFRAGRRRWRGPAQPVTRSFEDEYREVLDRGIKRAIELLQSLPKAGAEAEAVPPDPAPAEPRSHVLVASPYLPWPLLEGGKVAQYRTFEALRNVCRFTLVVPLYWPGEEEYARQFAEKFPNIKLVPVRYYQPRPVVKRSLARRVLGRLRRELGRAKRALKPARGVAKPAAQNHAGSTEPWYPFNHLQPAFIAAVEAELALGCDLFQAEFAEMLPLGALVSGRVPAIFVHHQVHFIYVNRFLAAGGPVTPQARFLAARMRSEEEAYLKGFDATIVFSETDRKAVLEMCPDRTVAVSPFPCPEDPLAEPLPQLAGVHHFVFVGSESHRPNVDGLRWFMESVWPLLQQQLPGAVIEVVGYWSPAAQQRLPQHQQVQFAGFVKDLRPALKNKIMVVPIWVGSGIRTKILGAWASSCPVVTTTVGAEGLPGQGGKDYLVADDAASFARACLELAHSPAKWTALAAGGLALVKHDYSLPAVREAREALYEEVLARSGAARKPPSL